MQRELQLLRGCYHLQLWSLNRACLTLSTTCPWHVPLGISLNQHVGGSHYQPDTNELECSGYILHYAVTDLDSSFCYYTISGYFVSLTLDNSNYNFFIYQDSFFV